MRLPIEADTADSEPTRSSKKEKSDDQFIPFENRYRQSHSTHEV